MYFKQQYLLPYAQAQFATAYSSCFGYLRVTQLLRQAYFGVEHLDSRCPLSRMKQSAIWIALSSIANRCFVKNIWVPSSSSSLLRVLLQDSQRLL